MQILRDYVPQPGFITTVQKLVYHTNLYKKQCQEILLTPFSIVLNTNHKGITYHNLTLDKDNYRP